VREGKAPPESRYPKIADGTLVRREALKFPEIPVFRTGEGDEYAVARCSAGPRARGAGDSTLERNGRSASARSSRLASASHSRRSCRK
jgi:hypothetical protein